jgi:hypothetical protein
VPLCRNLALIGFAALAVAGCARDGEFDSTGGITVTRSACPAVAVPAYTGDITIFNPPTSRDSRAIDVVANLTNVRSTCTEQGADMVANATFDVTARRSDPRGARDVVIPYFATVVQGGRAVVSKRVSSVALRFADGELRASTRGAAGAAINRAAATLPPEIEAKITRKRKAGDEDAALDPLADPEVKAAISRVSFELLLGFQLSSDQLQYNATR